MSWPWASACACTAAKSWLQIPPASDRSDWTLCARATGTEHHKMPLMMVHWARVDRPVFFVAWDLCTWWVQFIIKRDSQTPFRYAALQSRVGQRLLSEHGLPPQSLETLLLIDGGSAFTKSDAILRIAASPMDVVPIGLCLLIPVPYESRPRFIAKNQTLETLDLCCANNGPLRAIFESPRGGLLRRRALQRHEGHPLVRIR